MLPQLPDRFEFLSDAWIEEARAGAFLAICEVGKALHRGQPAERLWAMAIAAAGKWRVLAG